MKLVVELFVVFVADDEFVEFVLFPDVLFVELFLVELVVFVITGDVAGTTTQLETATVPFADTLVVVVTVDVYEDGGEPDQPVLPISL